MESSWWGVWKRVDEREINNSGASKKQQQCDL